MLNAGGVRVRLSGICDRTKARRCAVQFFIRVTTSEGIHEANESSKSLFASAAVQVVSARRFNSAKQRGAKAGNLRNRLTTLLPVVGRKTPYWVGELPVSPSPKSVS